MFLQKPFYSVPDNPTISESWLLERELIYHSRLFDLVIEVPKKFETNLASIPLFFRRLIPKNGRHRHAATLHDFLYSPIGHEKIKIHSLSRKDRDLIFLEAMEISKVPKWKRISMYQAVRSFGWISYNRK